MLKLPTFRGRTPAWRSHRCPWPLLLIHGTLTFPEFPGLRGHCHLPKSRMSGADEEAA